MMRSIDQSIRPKKLRGLPMQLDAAIWFVVVAVILAGIIAGAMHITKEARIARARLEMDNLRTAILEYEAFKETTVADGADFSYLFASFSDVNGDNHSPILQKKGNWDGQNCKDPWGQNYTLATTTDEAGVSTRKIVCSGPPGGGESFSLNL